MVCKPTPQDVVGHSWGATLPTQQHPCDTSSLAAPWRLALCSVGRRHTHGTRGLLVGETPGAGSSVCLPPPLAQHVCRHPGVSRSSILDASMSHRSAPSDHIDKPTGRQTQSGTEAQPGTRFFSAMIQESPSPPSFFPLLTAVPPARSRVGVTEFLTR